MKIGTTRVLASAIAFALLTASAQAQGVGNVGNVGGVGGGLGGRHSKQAKTEKAETPKPKVDEKAYNAALNQLPDKKFDTWSGVR